MCTHSAVAAEDHLVPLTDIQEQLRNAAKQRGTDETDLVRVLTLPAAQAEFAKYNISPTQVKTAVATLSDAELARLASRARTAEKDVEGGLIVGLLALIGLIVVIIIVVSLVAEATPPPSSSDEVRASTTHGGVEGGTSIPQVATIYG